MLKENCQRNVVESITSQGLRVPAGLLEGALVVGQIRYLVLRVQSKAVQMKRIKTRDAPIRVFAAQH